MARAPEESRPITLGKWLFAFVIPFSGLALGALLPDVLAIVSALAAVACGLLWMGPEVRGTRASRWVLVALAVLLGMTLLQVVPLPAGMTRVLAPATADIWDRALTPLRESGPAWHPLSVAPLATRVEVLRGFFYGAVFLSALRVAALENGERFLVRLIVVSALLMALSALAHNAVSAEKVFGIYRPRELYAYQPGRFSPLLNTNHLAAYLNLGACVALGALLTRGSMPRALSGSAALVLAATSMWQGSRGATGTLILGVVLTFALTLYSKRRVDGARLQRTVLAACAVGATIVVSIALSESRAHLLSRDFQKLTIAENALALIRSSPWFGVGRGGFESVFPSVHEGTQYITFNNPEDFIVQWLVEWGIPTSLAGFALLAWSLRPQVLLRAVRPATGAWVAIVASVVHETVDYHFEVPGVTALAAVCVAIVVSGRPSRRAHVESVASPARLAAFAVAIGTVLAIVGVARDSDHTLAEDRRTLSQMALDTSVTREQFRDAARAAMLRYPAEPFLSLMGAVRAQARGEGSVVPWVARALERNPRFGRAHFVLAQSLAAEHAPQARLEYRLAYEYDEGLRGYIVKAVVPLITDSTTALELVPDGPLGIPMLDALVVALAVPLPATAVVLDRELERRSPGAVAPFRRQAQAAASDVLDHAPWCDDGCARDALASARLLVEREPDQCSSHVLVARLRIARGEASGALDDLQQATDTVTDRAECQRQLITIAFESNQRRRSDLALEALVRGGCGAATECIALYRWAASTEESRGHYVRAVRLYRLALQHQPDADDLLQHIGALGDHEGLLSEGLDAYATLASRHPADPQWTARTAELRGRMGGGAGAVRRLPPH